MFQCIIQQRNGWGKNSPEFREVFPDVRVQLGEQLRCLDGRLETQVALVQELQDYFRRRAEVELEYSRGLDKLARSLTMRHKEQKLKREQWPLFSSYSCWQQLVTSTRTLSRDHASLADVYTTQLVPRLARVAEDVQRIYRRCREVGQELHDEILRVLHELHTTMKTYHCYQGEMRAAEGKLRLAEAQRVKLEQSISAEKLPRSKKYRLIEKEVQKRKNKFNDASLKALKARNEYVLCLEAANTTIHKYFVDDLSDLIDCMDFGFHQCVTRALLLHMSLEEGRIRSSQLQSDQLNSCINSLDSRLDKQRFLESNHTAFVIPKKFEFQGLRSDELVTVDNDLLPALKDELKARLYQLTNRIMSLRAESEEVWKTLETAETTLLAMITAKDYDCSALFTGSADITPTPPTRPPETVAIKMRADRHETEEFYLSKFREYLLGTSRIARLDSKHEHIRQTLVSSGETNENMPSVNLNMSLTTNQNGQPNSTKPIRRKRIGRLQMNGQPKLFGGSLEEYLEMSNQDIPLIVKSCIRVINLYGLHHQGIFRVSGSQVEINNFREAFERGEDPLADTTDASDINSVAGVLKLYLRELREPLFPIVYFELFMELAQLDSKEFIIKMKDLVTSLPRPFVVILRYLFSFLNHLSEFSDENMMDPYNLAICFGPTLVPVPEDKDQVQYQNQVNELIKNIILYYEDIFPPTSSIPGPMYEKFITREPDDNDVGDSPSDHAQEDVDSEVYPSEDECESLEATAQFDFLARSERELSFKKGDHLQLFTQVSNDWWRGRGARGVEGLIPDKYILLKIKDEERDKLELLKSSSSDESMRRRASSSNDSVLSGASGSTQNDSPLLGSGSSATWPALGVLGGLGGRSPTSLVVCDPPPPPLLSPTAEPVDSTMHKSASCTSLDSGKESACDDQLSRPDHLHHLSDHGHGAEKDKLTLCLKESALSPHSPDSGASGSSESPPTEAAAVSVILALSHSQAQPQPQPQPEPRTDPEPEPAQPEPQLEAQPPSQPPPQVQPQPQPEALFQASLRPASHTESSLPLSGLKRSHHSIDEALSSAQCVATAVLSGNDIADKNKNAPVVRNQVAALEVEQYSRSSSLEGVCDLRQKQTPDLVLDLPLRLNSSSNGHSASVAEEKDLDSHAIPSPTGPESPDMTTAAERFAKQNQCTLKKNTKASQSLGSPLESKSSSTSHSSPRHSKSVDCQSEKDVKSGVFCLTKQSSASAAIPSDTDKKPLGSSFKPPLKAKPQIMKKPLIPVSTVPVPPNPVSKDSDHTSSAPESAS
ncbi:SLIT-ROBO Rho GTPase-activating protein 1-like isoform X2 [Thrips palmi]|uniref:SLIT-ROBO Rho GTPase-activating protein 1-like isoform X2 n=1 Tax=Thrips palmi TaxID=161013 RepID=A0A6P8ZKS6_THRPL|nr:SLIT-ROBO Rho GTPase-activating protein 1-like isoform X2 [Thrips palmi]